VSEAERGGDVVLDITLFDWQGAVNPDGVIGEVEELVVEAPSGMITGGAQFSPVDLQAAEVASGIGYLRMVLTIPDVSPRGCISRTSYQRDEFPSDLHRPIRDGLRVHESVRSDTHKHRADGCHSRRSDDRRLR
jgi:hypothetical protein